MSHSERVDEAFDQITRNASAVVAAAKWGVGQWAVWHPGDGTQYRVKIVEVEGGPNEGDRVLLICVTDVLVSVLYTPPKPAYRFKPWSADRWRSCGLNPSQGYDWWPKVIEPLLRAEGVVV